PRPHVTPRSRAPSWAGSLFGEIKEEVAAAGRRRGTFAEKGLPPATGPPTSRRSRPKPRSWNVGPGKNADKEKPRSRSCGVLGKNPGDDLLSHARCTLPSARARFTSEFGMES